MDDIYCLEVVFESDNETFVETWGVYTTYQAASEEQKRLEGIIYRCQGIKVVKQPVNKLFYEV